MKIYYFIIWLWAKIPQYVKTLSLAIFLVISSAFLPSPYSTYTLLVILCLLLLFIACYFSWEALKPKWKEFNEEQNKLINVLSKKQ